MSAAASRAWHSSLVSCWLKGLHVAVITRTCTGNKESTSVCVRASGYTVKQLLTRLGRRQCKTLCRGIARGHNIVRLCNRYFLRSTHLKIYIIHTVMRIL